MDIQRLTYAELARRLERPAAQASSDFDLIPGLKSLPEEALRPAAVLVPLRQGPDGLQVVLTRRSRHLRHHPGQIAFPGGKIDDDDGGSAAAAALREAEEEIGLSAAETDILGTLAPHHTVTRFRVTPIVARIPADFVGVPEEGEVEEIFEVPLSFLLDPANLQIQSRVWQGTERRYYVIPYGPYYVWGATARMLKGFADHLGVA
ncbi:CoA pyrophosphatase [Algicella marina]|uniref:CoA pyrophosphatase n=2 Tax=Algicella marina TaxID=2683284 RepID=A0A6P1T733_9RHOB|nr:CoA pyrophosphatase [Algicella marina]